MMDQPLLLAASAIAFLSFAVHTFVGGRYAARPLINSTLPAATIWLNYLCWHAVTVGLLLIAGALALVALEVVHPDAGWLAVMFAAGISGASLLATARGGIPFYRFPASYLLASVCALAAAGLSI